MITREDFFTLAPGRHVVVNASGIEFTVVSNETPEPGLSAFTHGREVVLKPRTGGPLLVRGWLDGFGIVDEDLSRDTGLNGKLAKVVDVSDDPRYRD